MQDTATSLVLDLLAAAGGSTREAEVAARVRDHLLAAGVPAEALVDDGANRRSLFGGEVGNLVVQLPGRGALASAPRLLLSAHLDTVPLCAGAVPVRQGDRVVPRDSTTALGADNRAGCAAILALMHELAARPKLPHVPLTLAFFVQEEIGLVGSCYLDTALLGEPAMGINLDGGLPFEICHGAVGGAKWRAEIRGLAAHAGAHPEDGVSAASVFALAQAELITDGYHGRITQPEGTGTANVGIVRGGDATNMVLDQLLVRGECRSHNPAFLRQLVARYRTTYTDTAAEVTNAAGTAAMVEFVEESGYPPFRLERECAVVHRIEEAIARLGGKPRYRISNGAQDANCLSAVHGIPTVTIGSGHHNLHTTAEYLDLAEYHQACELLLALVTG